MKFIRLFLIATLLAIFSTSSFAICRATILCRSNNGKILKKIHLQTYRHGFLYTKCSLAPKFEKYLANKTLQQQLCEQKVKHCRKHKNCRTQLIFKKGWPFFGHH